MAYQTPYQIADVLDYSMELDDFFGYLKGRLTEDLSVTDHNYLLAVLDLVGRRTVTELQSHRQASGQKGIVILLETHLARCDYLADRLRAMRRSVVLCEMQKLRSGYSGYIDVEGFVTSVVKPMLSRRWLPWAFYEPAGGKGEKDVKTWQGTAPPDSGDDPSRWLQYCDWWTEELVRAGLGVASGEEALRRVISVLRTNSFEGTQSHATASYLDTALSVCRDNQREHRKAPLEVLILLVRENQPGHVLRALLVPFEVPCTSVLARESLLPAMEAVGSYFSAIYSPPEARNLVLSDYPGGVYCPGGASCVGTDHGCEHGSGARGQFDGPSAGPSLASLLAADALGWQMAPDTCATAELDRKGQVMALSDEQSDDEDPYLQAKGRTLALFAHAAGVVDFRVVVHSGDLSALKKGADSYRKEALCATLEASLPPEDDWSISWRAVSSLRDSLDHLLAHKIQSRILPGLYGDLVARLTAGEDSANMLAKEAANQILSGDEVGRWIISVPSPIRDIDGTGGFETYLARELYGLSIRRGGPISVPACLSIRDFFRAYYGHASEGGVLGRVVARLANIEVTDCQTAYNSRILQIEKDLSEGGLVLILRGLAGRDSSGKTLLGPDGCLQIQLLFHELSCGSRDASGPIIRNIVTVSPPPRDDKDKQLYSMLLTSYSFREWRCMSRAVEP